MSKRNENRPGYKKTKVGWIPGEWECVRLGNIASVTSGGTPRRDEPAYWGGSIPWISTSEIDFNTIREANEFITDQGLGSSSARLCPTGTLLMAMFGQGLTRGKVALLGIEACFNQACAAIMPNGNLHSTYLFLYLMAKYHKIRNQSQVGTQANLNAGIIKSLSIPLPPLPEQKKIAEILSAWDQAIEQVGKLIEAKQRLKKGLMQQLLSGRMRFAEFGKPVEKKGELPEGWAMKLISSIARVSFSGVDKKTHADEMPVRLCNYMDVYANDYITADLNFMPATASASEIEKFSLREGDVMITKDSETPDDIGIPAIVTEELESVVCGYHLALIRPNSEKVDPVFLSKELGSARSKRHFSTHANGATRFGLTTSAVMKTTVHLPPIDEQRRIASVLSTCDHEIQLLTQKHDLLQEQKKGLMQKLLTGEVRHPQFLKEGHS